MPTEAEWRAQPGPWAHLTKEQTDELIAAAVMAEREACATLVEGEVYSVHYRKWSYACGNRSNDNEATRHSDSLAAAIRART